MKNISYCILDENNIPINYIKITNNTNYIRKLLNDKNINITTKDLEDNYKLLYSKDYINNSIFVDIRITQDNYICSNSYEGLLGEINLKYSKLYGNDICKNEDDNIQFNNKYDLRFINIDSEYDFQNFSILHDFYNKYNKSSYLKSLYHKNKLSLYYSSYIALNKSNYCYEKIYKTNYKYLIANDPPKTAIYIFVIIEMIIIILIIIKEILYLCCDYKDDYEDFNDSQVGVYIDFLFLFITTFILMLIVNIIYFVYYGKIKNGLECFEEDITKYNFEISFYGILNAKNYLIYFDIIFGITFVYGLCYLIYMIKC